MNKVFLSGNLTRDPEIRYTQSGKATARMGIAVAHGWGENRSAYFFNLQAWEKTAEFCQNYLKKGSRVLVEGRLQTYSYEGKDGVQRSGVDIVVDNIEFAGAKRDNADDGGGDNRYNDNRPSNYGNKQNSRSNYGEEFAGEDISDDDVPF